MWGLAGVEPGGLIFCGGVVGELESWGTLVAFCARNGGFAEMMAFGAFYTATETVAPPGGSVLAASYWLRLSAGALAVYTAGGMGAVLGRRASLSSSAICGYLCASVVK